MSTAHTRNDETFNHLGAMPLTKSPLTTLTTSWGARMTPSMVRMMYEF